MKKILFLLILCIIKLNAYEYLYFKSSNVESFYYDNDNSLIQKKVYSDGNVEYNYKSFYVNVYEIKINYGHGLVSNSQFIEWLKNDLIFLNQFYTTNDITRNALLNYFYNENSFTDSNHINYENYELLYNENGLVVESIVNGKWAGLYDDNEKQFSGKLYDKDGFLIYNNGEQVDYIGKWLNQLIKPFDTTFMGVVNIISFAALSAIICYYVMDILWYIIDLALWALTGGRRHLSYEYYH